LPIHLHLKNEKTTVKLAREARSCLYWLPKIADKNFRGDYAPTIDEVLAHQPDYYITADDWGLSPAVNQGILKLAQKKHLQRVSVLAESPFASLHLDDLQKLDHVHVGLHFNLTHNSVCASPLHLLIYTLNPFHSKKKKQEVIRAELERQYSLLQNMGVQISHIDGHHHCHIFPVVATEVAQFSVAKKITNTRLPTHPSLWWGSKFLLPLLSLSAKRIFDRHQLKYRPFFYPPLDLFESSVKLRNALQDKGGFEIITHPAENADLAQHGCVDKYDHQRVLEFNALIK